MQTQLRTLSDSILVFETRKLVTQEQQIVDQVLDHLEEIYSRRIHFKLGYSSMTQFCIHELGYSPGTAQTRVDALRLTQALPEVKKEIAQNDANIHQAALLQKFFRNEEKITKIKRTTGEKKKLWTEIKGKSVVQSQKHLTQVNPAAFPPPPERDQTKVVSPEKTLISFVADEECIELMERLKELYPDEASRHLGLFKKALRIALKGKDPKEKTNKIQTSECDKNIVSVSDIQKTQSTQMAESIQAALPIQTSESQEKKRPYISVTIERDLLRQANYQCTYVSPMNGRRCSQKKGLELEHKHPFAKGGTSDAGNLTVLCKAHNSLRAIEEYGARKMQSFLKGLVRY